MSINFELVSEFPTLFGEVILSEYSHISVAVIPTGSRYNCSPPVRNTDEDYLIYPSGSFGTFLKFLMDIGYKEAVDRNTTSLPKSGCAADFRSFKKGKINLIVTHSSAYFNNHRTAGYVCKKLNLLDKEDRILVYEAVLYGKYVGEEPKLSVKPAEIDFFSINKSVCGG